MLAGAIEAQCRDRARRLVRNPRGGHTCDKFSAEAQSTRTSRLERETAANAERADQKERKRQDQLEPKGRVQSKE